MTEHFIVCVNHFSNMWLFINYFMPGIPYPFALKIKFYASSQVKWSMFYILP
jgi:hypothetical protein